jgi:integrase
MPEEEKHAYRKPTSTTGIFVRQSPRRRVNGKPDRCFDISYQIGPRLIWEKIGWESEGYTEEMAQEIRAERIQAIRHGFGALPLRRNKAPLFSEIAEQYIEWAKENRANKGIDDASRYKKHLAPRFSSLRLDQITPLHMEKMKKELTQQGASPCSVEHCLKLVRQMVNKAKAWGLYDGENPIKGVKLPRYQNQRLRFLSYEEAKELLQELKKISPQVHDIALISLHTGMRAGEIFNMKSYDVDLNNGFINIPDSKSGQSRRAYLTKTVKEILAKRLNGNSPEYVFKSEKGTKVCEVSETFARVVERMGMNDGIDDRRYRICFHSLRHTCASWLALQGEPILTIKELLGHKSLEMTLRYAHLVPDQKREAVARMERALK